MVKIYEHLKKRTTKINCQTNLSLISPFPVLSLPLESECFVKIQYFNTIFLNDFFFELATEIHGLRIGRER
jgi:hypothetical protein